MEVSRRLLWLVFATLYISRVPVRAAQPFEEGSMEFPLGVSVWMIGVSNTNDNTGDPLKLKTVINPVTFESTLQDILPYYQPPRGAASTASAGSDCTPEHPAPSSVTFGLTYTVLSSVPSEGKPPALASLERAFIAAYGT